jgi:DNA-binding NtrC family response regulator
MARAVGERWTLERLEREYILEVIKATQGNIAKAATSLGVDRRTLFRKLRQYRDRGLMDDDLSPEMAEPDS